MKTERNILVAFIINFMFSIFEFIGGIITGSVAIISDSIHDLGDAASIGLSYFFERKSKQQPDEIYTFGYMRYSVFGSVITTLILIIGSTFVIYNAINRIIAPIEINYSGMIIFSLVGVCVNFTAAFFTRHGDSLNQKAVNLHMLEDVLGWIVVLIGGIIMHFTNITIIDPILSICVATFILINAFKNLKSAIYIFLEKSPLNVKEIKEHILRLDGVLDVHHIHIRSIDGHNNYATMHIVTNDENHSIKSSVRKELKKHGIVHVTLELEKENECCHEINCHIESVSANIHHHHH